MVYSNPQDAMPKNNAKTELPFPKEKGRTLDVSALESWLWEAACVIRGPLDVAEIQGLHSAAGLPEAALRRFR